MGSSAIIVNLFPSVVVPIHVHTIPNSGTGHTWYVMLQDQRGAPLPRYINQADPIVLNNNNNNDNDNNTIFIECWLPMLQKRFTL